MNIGTKVCPCKSGKDYTFCCQKYHKGALPETALALMRSRFSAYALGLTSYIIETTHQNNPHYVHNRSLWEQQLKHYSQQVIFKDLEILEAQLGGEESYVTFIAYLSSGKTDLTFTEKSRFLKEGIAWKYIDGRVSKGKLTVKEINALK